MTDNLPGLFFEQRDFLARMIFFHGDVTFDGELGSIQLSINTEFMEKADAGRFMDLLVPDELWDDFYTENSMVLVYDDEEVEGVLNTIIFPVYGGEGKMLSDAEKSFFATIDWAVLYSNTKNAEWKELAKGHLNYWKNKRDLAETSEDMPVDC